MLHCLISGRLELRWNLFSRESLLSSHDELVGEGLAPVGAAVVVVSEPTRDVSLALDGAAVVVVSEPTRDVSHWGQT